MRLFLIDDDTRDKKFSRECVPLDYMERIIEDCNNAISVLIDPITHDKGRVSVHKTYNDYMNLVELSRLLNSNITREMFRTIQSDLNKNLPSNLADIPISEVKDLLESYLQSNTIYELIDNIAALLRKEVTKKMNYLVVIILEDALIPIYNYYNTLEKAIKDIKKMKGVEDVTVYKYNPFKSKELLNKAYKK